MFTLMNGESTDQSKKGANVLIGTSGYSYPDWVGPVYPPDLPKDRWLDFYVRQFPFCELNFSYYRMPTPEQMHRYTELDSQIAIKAHKSLTHERDNLKNASSAMRSALDVLAAEERLATTLFQFPYSFHFNSVNREYLDRVLNSFAQYPVTVEFRNPKWVKEETMAMLKKHGAGITLTDAPDVSGSMPRFQAVTGPMGYIRFHGRNRENWYGGDNVSRYDYLYTTEELMEWMPRIASMAKQAQTIYIAFNNHARGQAVENARMLKTILKEMGVEVK